MMYISRTNSEDVHTKKCDVIKWEKKTNRSWLFKAEIVDPMGETSFLSVFQNRGGKRDASVSCETRAGRCT